MKIKDLIIGDGKYKLPVGYLDRDGVNHNVVTLKAMTGEIEEEMEKPKVKVNSGKMITELIYGVVDSLGTLPKTNKDMIRDLQSVDRDFLLIANAIESFGKDEEFVEFEARCTKCGEKNEVQVMLENLDVDVLEEDGEREFTFELKNGIKDSDGKVHKDITIILPTGRIQEIIVPILAKNQAVATTRLLHAITKKLGDLTLLNPDTFAKMSKRDRDLIQKYMTDIKIGVNFKIDVTCFDCGNEFIAPLPVQELLGE